MKPLRRFLRRLRALATAHRDEARLRAEIEEHLALQTADNLRAGMSPAEARRQAALKFGGPAPIAEAWRDERRFAPLEHLARDTRYALRGLRLAPAFTLAAILTLALGIGGATSIFTLVNAVLLQSLPVAQPGELYRIGRETHCCYVNGYSQEHEFSLFSYDLYRYLRDHLAGFTELAAFPSIPITFGVRRAGRAEPAQTISGEFVSGNYFVTFGLRPSAGRVFSNADDAPGVAPVAILSHRFWSERYSSDPSIVGSVIQVNDRPVTVVGIAPPGFFGETLRPASPDLYLPLNAEPLVDPDTDLAKYSTHWLGAIGRIAPGASPAAVEAQLRVALSQWLASHLSEMSPADRLKLPAQTLYLSPGGSGVTVLRNSYRRWLEILMAVTAFVLLIVCANLANLMLVRGMERRRLTSLSMALGARPSRLIAQSLTESVILSVFGGAAGLAIAYAGARLILRYAFPALPGAPAIPIDASPSVPVLLFAFAASLLTGIVFGVAPAWAATRVDPIEALRGSQRVTPRSSLFARKSLLVLQTALSLALLTSAGLLTAALSSLESRSLGFEPEHRLVANINPRLAGYHTPQLPQLYRRLRESLAAVPGVASAALCLYSPPNGGWGSGVFIDGQPSPGPRDEPSASWNRVSSAYFDAVGTPVLRGRPIAPQDTAASLKVAVVSQAFARRFFHGEDPIGRYFGNVPDNPREYQIVGIVQDARYITRRVDEPSGPIYFIPETQADYSQTNIGSLFLRDLVIRARPGADVASAQIRQAVAQVDPNLALISIRPMVEQVSGQFTQQRLLARLTSLFGALSLILACIGLYGIAAYNASRRTAEIGVRIALGAGRAHVVSLVLRGALSVVGIGLLCGAPLALFAGRFLGSQLYGLSPYNPFITLTAALALGLSALTASLVPALRASRVSPVEALRGE